MTKYEIVERGYGKTKYYVPVQVMGKRLKTLESKGIKIYDSRDEAKTEAMEMTNK